MLGNGKFNKTVASTLSEIRGLVPLAEEGVLEEVGNTISLRCRDSIALIRFRRCSTDFRCGQVPFRP